MNKVSLTLLRFLITIALYFIAFRLIDNTGWEKFIIGLLFVAGVSLQSTENKSKKKIK